MEAIQQGNGSAAMLINDGALAGKKILVVDDDARNIFALTSVLESYRMQVIYAEDGERGIAALEKNPTWRWCCSTSMMPGMDGYETMKAIRADNRFEEVPIVALTAKALKYDWERCLQAGASDYLPKPVDPDRLLQMVRQWSPK